MLFEYQAKNLKGETITGTIESINQNAALEMLARRQMIIISLKETSALPIWRRPINLSFLERVTGKDMVFLSRQLSVMVMAGLPLVESLEILARQTSKPALKKIVESVAENVRGGSRFSSALAKYPKVFNNFYINMVRAGETAGKLDEVLDYLANEQEKNYDLMSKIRGAMIYPIFVISAVIGVMILMMVFVVPQLTDILKESGVSLPLPTKILIATSDFLENYTLLIVLFLVVFVVAFRFFLKSKAGQMIWDKTLLKMPIFGVLFKQVYLVRFTRSLSTLIIGGIPLTAGLKIVSEVVSNYVFKEIILDAIIDVEEGRSVSNAFLNSSAVPKMLPHLMAIGEETGKLDEVLGKIADFYSREVENILSKLVTLLEPIILIFLGVVVGGMVASIILPMYKLATAF
ncbi:MAG: type II secretion system F family protein [Patescibacteria group bacterium]|jgi:type IV pilus assembly protein PilC|nr:type II secretion system F family protein [Patescibacteria group bacterium]MDD5172841.1 type II secretion system F family protein [Patescibacteria group bacterium]